MGRGLLDTFSLTNAAKVEIMIFVDSPKKRVKTIKDIEKLMDLMQDRRISKIAVDGVEIEVHSFKSDIKAMSQQTKGSGVSVSNVYDGYDDDVPDETMFAHS